MIRAERGSIAPFLAVIATALLMVAGMAYDGGELLAAQARARDLAGNAARAGAQEIDLDVLRETGRAVLRVTDAEATARAFLGATDADVVVFDDRITVTVRLDQEMRILPGPDRTVSATESATPVAALDEMEEGP